MSHEQFLLTNGFQGESSDTQYIYTLEVTDKEQVQAYHMELFGYENSEVESLEFEVTEDAQEIKVYAVGSREVYTFEDINELMMFM